MNSDELTTELMSRIKQAGTSTNPEALQSALESLKAFGRSLDNERHRRAVATIASGAAPLLFHMLTTNMLGELGKQGREMLEDAERATAAHQRVTSRA